MEYDQFGTRIENNLSGDKTKKDGETKKDSKKESLRVPLPKEIDSKPLEMKTFGDNLNDLFGGKKDEGAKEDGAKAEAKDLVDNTDVADELTATEPLNGNGLHDEVVNVRQLEPMADKFDIPLNSVARELNDRAEQPPEPVELLEPADGSHLIEATSEDERPEPHVFAEQPKPAEPEKIEMPPVAAESGGGSHEPPPSGPEWPAAPGPEPEPSHVPEAAVMTVPDHLRPELIQQAHAVDPSVGQAQPAPPESHYYPHRHPEHDGAVIGLGLFEAWRHHRMNKRTRKIEAKQNKRLKQIEQAQAETRDQQYRASVEQAQKNQRLQQELAARPTTTELAAEHNRYSPAERARPVEQARQAAEKIPSPERIIEEEPVPVPPEHHIVRSEWHNIEVDKSGHPVEAPVWAYGEEFKREQHQEARRQDELTAASAVGYSAVNTVIDEGQATSSTPSGETHNLPLTSISSSQSVYTPHDTTTVWLWIVLILIVLAIIATLILR